MSGEGQLEVRDRVCTSGQWTWNGLPRAVVTAPNLPEFKKHPDSVLRHTL